MATIHEVAKAAGVSISTVSYALSGKRPISPDTRRRIEDAVTSLGYRPHAAARTLAGSRTNIFALTEPLRMDTHTPTHMAFVLATAIAARRVDYDLLLLTDAEASAGMRRVADSNLADAIIVLDVAPDDERVSLARSIEIPTIFVGVPDDNDGLLCVDLDFAAAAHLAVDRLVEQGHRSIGLLGQPDRAYEMSNFPPRVRRAFDERAAELGIETEFRTSGGVRMSPGAVRRAIGDMLARGVTAIVFHCADDAHAVALAELAERGVRIPDDLSVVSVGASFDTAALTVPMDAIPLVPQASCDEAVRLATQSLDADPPAPGVRLLPPTYVSHGSTAAVSSHGAVMPPETAAAG